MEIRRRSLRRTWNRLWPDTLRGQALTLLTAITIVAVLAGTTVIAFGWRVSSAYTAFDLAQDQETRLIQLESATSDQAAWINAYVGTGNPENISRVLKAEDQVASLVPAIRRGETSEDRNQTEALLQAVQAWQLWADQHEGIGPAPLDSSTDGGRLLVAVDQAGATANQKLTAEAAARLAAAHERQLAQTLAVIGFATLSLALLGVLGFKFTQSTLQPLRRLIDGAQGLAIGRPVELDGLDRRDEVGRLASSLAAWRESESQREEIARSMLDISLRVDTPEILSLAGERLQRLLAADQIVIGLIGASGWRVGLSQPFDFYPADPAISYDALSEAWQDAQPEIAPDVSDTWDPAFAAWAREHDLGPIMVSPLLSSGRLLGVVSMLRRRGKPGFDDADVRRSELVLPHLASALHVATLFGDLRRANRELGEASVHKSQFLANMSHELRTPLNAILGFCELLLDSPQMAADPARRERYLKNISSSGRHLLGLINDVLDLAKVEAGRLELNREPVAMELAVSAALATVQPLANGRQVTLELEVEPDLLVEADRMRLDQILFNLLSNGIKFTPAGGRVSVSARRDRRGIVIEVADTGIGIAAKDQAAIFREFHQLDAGRARGRDGAGLGLALTKRLVELHGGSLGVTSELGKGSVFTVRLREHNGDLDLAPTLPVVAAN
ncbi:MAG TPA: ATP-binding protein [Candidatus Dormibacteraeota bacterium]